MERLIAWWVHNPVAANLLMVGILLSGFLGFQTMEREAFPQVKPYQAQIDIVWPGAAPQEVEEQIIVRIEQALEDLDQVRHVYGTAMEGFAEMTVTTYPSNDINAFINDVKNAVDSVTSLPRDIENPRVRRTRYRNEMIRVAVHGDISERELTRLAEDLRNEVGGPALCIDHRSLWHPPRGSDHRVVRDLHAPLRTEFLGRFQCHSRQLREPLLRSGSHRHRRRTAFAPAISPTRKQTSRASSCARPLTGASSVWAMSPGSSTASRRMKSSPP